MIALLLLLILLLPNLTTCNVQETLIGIAGKDFVVIGADTSISTSGSIAWTASRLDKIQVLQGGVLVAAAGDAADSDRLVGTLKAHCAIREWETSMGSDVEYIAEDGTTELAPSTVLSVDAVAYLARYIIAQSLRSSSLNVCLLVAGTVDAETRQVLEHGPSITFAQRLQRQVRQATGAEGTSATLQALSSTVALYWLDQYGSKQKLCYGAHGFASNFCLSILDQGYRPDLTQQEAIALMRSCFQQLRQRYIIHSPHPPCIKCLDKDGCHIVEELLP
jgi:20S proteasome subunit beta 4